MSNDGGLSSFQRRMRAIPIAVREATTPALLQSGNELASTMKRLAETSRDSGDLIDSIEVTPPGKSTPPFSQPGGERIAKENEVIVTAGNEDVRYAHLVEFGVAEHANGGMFEGTVNPGTEAQPFFWPAFRLTRKRLASRIKRAIGKAVRDNWGGGK